MKTKIQNTFTLKFLEKSCKFFVLLAAAMAITLYLFHDLRVNPQYDNQGLWHAADLLTAIRGGQFFDFIFTPRKYPLFYLLNNLVVYLPFDLFLKEVPREVFILIGRGITFFYAIGSFLLLRTLSKRLFNDTSIAMILLATSILYTLFTTAIRPHVIVGFWSLSSYYFALLYRSNNSKKNLGGTFISAIFAFCTLQSGLLAFVFPLWSILDTKKGMKRMMQLSLFFIPALILCIALGYPFLLSSVLDGSTGLGMDLGHNVGVKYSWGSAGRVIAQLAGSSPFILLFFSIALARYVLKRDAWNSSLTPAFIFVSVFLGVFLFHYHTKGRFFIPILPFVALLGVSGFKASPQLVRIPVLLVTTIVYMRFGYLTTLPNSYDAVSTFANQRTGAVFIQSRPVYFYRVPVKRLVSTQDYPWIETIIVSDKRTLTASGTWEECAAYNNSTEHSDVSLLWEDTEWAYYNLFTNEMLGPPMQAYCRTDQTQLSAL